MKKKIKFNYFIKILIIFGFFEISNGDVPKIDLFFIFAPFSIKNLQIFSFSI